MDLLQFTKDNPPPVGTPDAKGTPFDPGKHCARVNKNTLRWIPRSPGRYNKGQTRLPNVDAATQAAPSIPAETTAPAGAVPVKEVTAAELIDLPGPRTAPPVAEVKPGAAAEASPAPEPQPAAGPIPDVAPDAPPPGAGKSDATLSPDAGGNLLARVLYGVTGWFTGDRKAATARGEEHKAIASTFSAFLSFRGIALVGGLAIAATVVCYLLDENRGESVGDALKRRFSGKRKPGDAAKPAEPTAAPVTVTAPKSGAPTPVIFPE